MSNLPSAALSTGNGGRILLILTSRDARSAEQLSTTSGLSPAVTIRQLHRLAEQGFIIVATDDAAHILVYRLNPKGVRTEALDPHQRILVVEEEEALRALVVLVLEEEGYTVVAISTPADAAALLEAVAFDLVITDGFSRTPGAVFTNAGALLQAAEATPVALFTAHRMELEPVQAAGFRDLIEMPFDLPTLEWQVRTLLQG